MPATATARRLLSTSDAANYLGLSRMTVHRLISGGELPVVTRFKHYRRVDIRDLDQFVERNKTIL